LNLEVSGKRFNVCDEEYAITWKNQIIERLEKIASSERFLNQREF